MGSWKKLTLLTGLLAIGAGVYIYISDKPASAKSNEKVIINFTNTPEPAPTNKTQVSVEDIDQLLKIALSENLMLYQRVNISGHETAVRGKTLIYNQETYGNAILRYKKALKPKRLVRWSKEQPIKVKFHADDNDWTQGHKEEAIKSFNAIQEKVFEKTGLTLILTDENKADIEIRLPDDWRDKKYRDDMKASEDALDKLPSFYTNEIKTTYSKLLPEAKKLGQNIRYTITLVLSPDYTINYSLCNRLHYGNDFTVEILEGCVLSALGFTNIQNLNSIENWKLLSLLYRDDLKPGAHPYKIYKTLKTQ